MKRIKRKEIQKAINKAENEYSIASDQHIVLSNYLRIQSTILNKVNERRIHELQ
jgi:hypothetical protein